MKNKKLSTTVLSAMLAVISLILSLVKMAVPFIPPFLTLDLSFIPLFFGLIVLGYKPAITISLLKNFLHFLLISREPIGSFANIIVEVVFISCLLYFYKKGNKQIIIGGTLGTIAVTIVMTFMNYFVLLPLYGMITDLSDLINNTKLIVTSGVIPFNIIKGIFLIVLFFLTKKIVARMPQSLVSKFEN